MLLKVSGPTAPPTFHWEFTQLSVHLDKTLTCRDCGATFVFTAGEQEFFAQKGFTNEPGRCPECRAASKARRNGGYAYVSQGEYTRPERQMYPAVCSACGKATEVPFEPRLDKPVYCSDCFTPRNRVSGGSYDRRGSNRRY
jgi:CxxC-x17-CxxC domain-containing protein